MMQVTELQREGTVPFDLQSPQGGGRPKGQRRRRELTFWSVSAVSMAAAVQTLLAFIFPAALKAAINPLIL